MSSQLLAEVKVAKMKDCPMLTAGKITPVVMQSWTLACKRYMKHAGKTPSEIVSFVAEGMFEPRLISWYQADQTRIDALSLADYIKELSALVLDKNWAHDILEKILSSKQGNRVFIDWKIEVENLNAILLTSSPTHALSTSALKLQLQSNLHPDLHLNISNEPLVTTMDLAAWSIEVKERDDRMRAEDARTQRLIDANNAARTARRGEKKDLLSRITEPQQGSTSGVRSAVDRKTSGVRSTVDRKFLPALTISERKLLNEHSGCTRCRTFYVGHRAEQCPMKANNSWPDVDSYHTLTLEMASAAAPKVTTAYIEGEVQDDETDSYVTHSSEIPFTVPHLYVQLTTTGPHVSEFPIPIQALIDVGSPSTVISSELANKLGLRRYKLPLAEDNLASLSESPIRCKEYVKFEVQSGLGQWISRTIRAKVNVGLPIPLILGMPFLSSEHIVIDPHARTATDKHSGYDLVNPPSIPLRKPMQPRVIPPPTPRKIQISKPTTFENSGKPTLAGYLLPAPIMAAVRDRIESIAFQEVLKAKDTQMKLKFADRFPLRLPDNMDDLPEHIFHRIRLKDPTKVTNGRGYAAPKKYQISWKKLLDEHLASGRMQPSSSEYASPAFCVPKYQGGTPDLTVPPLAG